MLVDILLKLPRWTKRTVLASIDFLLLSLALWAAFSLRLGELYFPTLWHDLIILISAPVLGILAMFHMRIYKFVTRRIALEELHAIALALVMSVGAWAVAIVLSDSRATISRSAIVIYCILSIAFVWAARSAIAAYLNARLPERLDIAGLDEIEVKNILIYGTGSTSLHLIESLLGNPHYHIEALLDDDPSIWGQRIHGIKVYRPDYLESVAPSKGIQTLFVAKPDASQSEKSRLLKYNKTLDIQVLPTMSAIVAGEIDLNQFKPIAIEDLLGRSPVAPDEQLLGKAITGKSVMVTGAGGSIGSELCRQIYEQKPATLVLFEQSELALYEIEQEISERVKAMTSEKSQDRTSDQVVYRPHIAMVLGSVCDREIMRKTITDYGVHTIYHAAAYKHVPIVEFNPVSGLRNNVWGTVVTADLAAELGVERFVFVSTDKAVRPTNIMGTSKRISEVYLQGMASRDDVKTVFTMVRFGNVLGSSGSVVRKFREQIKSGGPLTVTHPDITRYFMSIPEAAALVIQAGSIATGGEVFVLNMGAPVKIVDLAKSMVRLMGCELRTEEQPDGDIEITFVGLRPGEKLIEELLIGGKTSGTEHPKIMRSEEDYMPYDRMTAELEKLEETMSPDAKSADLIAQLQRIVTNYKPDASLAEYERSRTRMREKVTSTGSGLLH